MKIIHWTLVAAVILLPGCAATVYKTPQNLCDSKMRETTPTSRFEINRADGTAFDSKTKLTWRICAEGQHYSEGHCTGIASGFSWDDAMRNFGDKGNDWRLPNVYELGSIVERRCWNPAINGAVFPNSPSGGFWSATSLATIQTDAWNVSFSNSTSLYIYGKQYGYYVRLVRGEQWIDSLNELGLRQKLEEEELSRRKKLEEEELSRRKKLEEKELVLRQELEKEELGRRKKLEEEELAAQKIQKEKEELLTLLKEVMKAEQNASVSCNNKLSCDKMFSLTQIYITSNASQKLQVTTDTIIETYNPTEIGNIGINAFKIPGKGDTAKIGITVSCKSDNHNSQMLCMINKLQIYRGFPSFINKMYSN